MKGWLAGWLDPRRALNKSGQKLNLSKYANYNAQ